MNFTKAQNIVFKAIFNSNEPHKFQLDENHLFVTPDAMHGFVFPVEIINFNSEKIPEMKPLLIKEIIKPENKLTITDDLKLARGGREMCRRFKINGRSVFVRTKLLECFQNANFYQDRENGKTPVIVTESLSALKEDFPVGIVLPMIFYDCVGYYADELEKGETEE